MIPCSALVLMLRPIKLKVNKVFGITSLHVLAFMTLVGRDLQEIIEGS